MILFKKAKDLRQWLEKEKIRGKTIGFVPTMGALHEGHIELIRASRQHVDITVCSIFVNPAQFNDPKDYEKYPVSIEKDIQMLIQAGSNLLFLPSVAEIYPDGQSGLETYDLGPLESLLEGKYRPGHFQGVCQVMSRLLNMVKPDHLFMGQKDYQQCLVVQRLIELMGISLTFHTVPTIREADGLAKSSRNRRLTPAQREDAIAISQTLFYIRDHLTSSNSGTILQEAKDRLEAAHFKTDYISIANAKDLQPIEKWNGKDQAVALIAAFQEEVRLIDNLILN